MGSAENYTVRSATLEDVDDLVSLVDQLGYQVTPAALASQLDQVLTKNDHVIYVAVTPRGRVMGSVQAYLSASYYAGQMVEVTGLVVDKQFRGYGIGKELMDYVENWGKRKACQTINLRANTKRVKAHKFYEKLGYQCIKQQVNFRKQLPK